MKIFRIEKWGKNFNEKYQQFQWKLDKILRKWRLFLQFQWNFVYLWFFISFFIWKFYFPLTFWILYFELTKLASNNFKYNEKLSNMIFFFSSFCRILHLLVVQHLDYVIKSCFIRLGVQFFQHFTTHNNNCTLKTCLVPWKKKSLLNKGGDQL